MEGRGVTTPEEWATVVLNLIRDFGGIDGEHHKQWLLDQIVRVLTVDEYHEWLALYRQGGSEWDAGIAP